MLDIHTSGGRSIQAVNITIGKRVVNIFNVCNVNIYNLIDLSAHHPPLILILYTKTNTLSRKKYIISKNLLNMFLQIVKPEKNQTHACISKQHHR